MSTPLILIVYANPAITAIPVPPYGAERIAQSLKLAGCEARLCAPWLWEDPLAALEAELDRGPALVGFSVRNLDDALVVRSGEGDAPIDTIGYLPEIQPLVDAARARGLPVLFGGAGFSAGPEGVLRALGGGVGIRGSAEDLIWRMGRAMAEGTPFPEALPEDARVVRWPPAPASAAVAPAGGPTAADRWRPPPGPTPRMSEYLTLARARGTAMPVQVSAGCDRRCTFCVEASFLDKRVVPRPAEDVVAEVRLLARAGVRRVFLIASELNAPDARHAIAVLRGIQRAGVQIELRGFLQPAPFSEDLLDALIDAGLDPGNLSVEFGHLDDALLRAGAGPANLPQIERLVELWNKKGIPTLGGAVLLGAHPQEGWESIDRALENARRLDGALPGGLGLAWATGGRVYAAAPLGQWVAANLEDARPDLYGAITPGFAAPLVFSRPAAPRELFRYVEAGLEGMRGRCFPLNAEAPDDMDKLLAERRVDRGVLALADDDPDAAEVHLRGALALAPEHREALKQLGTLQANLRGDFKGAIATFTRLRAAVADEAHLIEDVDRALAQLERLVGQR